MPVRLTGMVSGMDTDTLIQQLVSAKRSKIDNIKGKKTKLEWQKEAWTDMNKKIYSFYTGSLSKMKSQATFKTKKATSSDNSKVEVKANPNAAAGSHTIEVKSVASATYLTSGKIKTTGFDEKYDKQVTDSDLTLDKMNNVADLKGKKLSITIGEGDDAITQEYEFGDASSIEDMQSYFGGKVEITLKEGKLSITNKTASKETDADGNETYIDGESITITGNALEFFGVSVDGGVTLTAESSEDGPHEMIVGKAFTQEATRSVDKVSGSSRVAEVLGLDIGPDKPAVTITVKINNNEGMPITIEKDTTMSQLADKFKSAGINASFDESQGRFFLSSKGAGKENVFELSDDGTSDILVKLKLKVDYSPDVDYIEGATEDDASYIKGSSAVVVYNGALIESNSNELSVNGLNITVKDVTTQKVNITVNNDNDAVYDTIKKFVNDYNTLLTDMYEKYSADSSKGYDPLTDEQKEEMSEKEIENWEKKIKDSLLRRDDTLNTLMSTMRNTMMKTVEVTLKDGTKTKLSLSSVGIVTGNYTERGLLHINGDEDDSLYAAKDNTLKEWIENDPEALMQLFAGVQNETTGQQEGIGNTLYSEFNDKMKSSTLSSALTFYNDKYMDKQMKSYQERIDELEDKLVDLEDSYYKKFAAMETALSKINTQSSYLTNMFGGGV